MLSTIDVFPDDLTDSSYNTHVVLVIPTNQMLLEKHLNSFLYLTALQLYLTAMQNHTPDIILNLLVEEDHKKIVPPD